MKAKGYISSRPLNNGLVYEQSIQNLVIRNFCEKIGYAFLLSGTEYSMKKSYLTLNQIYEDIAKYQAIIFFSYEQLPNSKVFFKDFKKIIKMKKKIFFALENIEIKNEKNLNDLLDLIKMNRVLKYSLTKIKSK